MADPKPEPAKSMLSHMMALFGWYQASPVNFTKDEAERRGTMHGDSGGGGPAGRLDQASSDPVARIVDMLGMSESELVGPILEVYAEEVAQPDINKGRCLWYECNDTDVEKDLNEMLDRIGAEDHMIPIVTGMAGTGNEFRRVLYNEDGVQQFPGVRVTEVRRLWDATTKRLLGFRWMGHQPKAEDVLYSNDNTVFTPWSFIHFRRLYRSDTEYGVAVLDKLFPIWRKLEQSIDAMVVYRRHIMPSRIAVKVDTMEQDVLDAMETVHQFATFIRNNVVKTSQGLETRFNPPALDSILYIPIRGSEDKTDISVLKGDTDVPDVPDIESLLSMFYGGARVPKAYMGQSDGDSGLAKASLVSQDIRFARVIRNLRRGIVSGFYRLAQLHLMFKGKDPADYNIKVQMSRISSIEEEVNVAILEKQAGLARTIADICQQLEIPNRDIIDLVFREYLSVPRYFIDIAKLGTSIQRAIGGDDGGDMGGIGGIGGMGGGGGGGDMDFDFGGEDVIGDEPEPEQEEEPIEPTPQVAGRRGRSNNLLEFRKTSKKFESVVAAICSEIGRGKKLNQEQVLKLKKSVHNVIENLGSIIKSKRSSLVEDWTGAEVASEKLTVKGGGKLMESARAELRLEEVVESDSGSEETHESVQITRRLRKKKPKQTGA